MITLSGYQVSKKLHESVHTVVYRGRREMDDQPVILKILKHDYPTPEQIARFRREYEMTCQFKAEDVIKAYGLEKYQHSLAMILEDFGGESLTKLLPARQLNLAEFLHLAIRITGSLGVIHQQRIMHKDINPSNIVVAPPASIDDLRLPIDDLNKQSKIVNPPPQSPPQGGIERGGWQVKIIDFGIATALSRENPEVRNPNVLEGTLAYLSPEQTGRMNRAIDYRTDFYSLGVTFYEMLTGQLPFQSTDAMELVHAHLAQTPPPLSDLKPDIPPVISKIVMKLMAKTAEERYQSAFGLQADLQRCLDQVLDPKGFGNLSGLAFDLGQHDISDRFQVSQKLYGREQEIETLLAAFERITADGEDKTSQSKIENQKSNCCWSPATPALAKRL